MKRAGIWRISGSDRSGKSERKRYGDRHSFVDKPITSKESPLAFPDLLEAKLLLDQNHRDPTGLVLRIDGQQFIDGAGLALAVGLLGAFTF